MFMPCPNCGFLVALIAGREMSQRCPRCGSALLSEGDVIETLEEVPQRRGADAGGRGTAPVSGVVAPVSEDAGTRDEADVAPPQRAIERVGAQRVEPVAESTAAPSEPARSTAAAPIDTRDIDAPVGDATSTDADLDTPTDTDAIDEARSRIARAVSDGPSFARRRATQPRGRRWPIAAIVATLAVVFGLQLLLAQRTALAADARWRPLVMQTCGVLGCEVPAWREPQAYRMVARNVRPNPRKAGVLHVTATVRNDARWPQPAPVIVLSLSDLDGRLVGARAVAPHDYGQRVTSLVAPGDSLDIAFDVREPAARVESYDFQLQ
ncbi:DUF3426 domain-containing protein [Cognatilysobacter terrigena]|uniref:DUF3426 domain-containing protein n=1 Tax=Cognatilysobacter terrigena TaxID=2488749 RepID=UPI0010608580|nr:DUF3426 domain-containing protein [Lysobacter terrigena]